MAERELVAAEALGGAVENAAAQARAERAVRGALFHVLGDDAVRVLADDLERSAARFEEMAERSAVVAGLALVEMHRDERHLERQARHELREKMEERVAVLAAAHRDEDAVAGREQGVLLARRLRRPVEPALQPFASGGHDGGYSTLLPEPRPYARGLRP